MSEAKPSNIQPAPTESRSVGFFPPTVGDALDRAYTRFHAERNQAALEILEGTRMFFEAEILKAMRGDTTASDAARRLTAHALDLRAQTETQFRAARHDKLTGLPNKLAFLEEIAKHVSEYESARESLGSKNESDYTEEDTKRLRESNFGILFIDLDGFKSQNDKHGHQVGDDILAEAGHRLAKRVRQGHVSMPEGLQQPRKITETDFAARYGGEELVVIVSGATTDDDLASVGYRVVKAFNDSPFETRKGPISQTASVGGARYQGGNAMDTVRLADERLYIAKSHGKDLYVGKMVGPVAP